MRKYRLISPKLLPGRYLVRHIMIQAAAPQDCIAAPQGAISINTLTIVTIADDATCTLAPFIEGTPFTEQIDAPLLLSEARIALQPAKLREAFVEPGRAKPL